MRASRSSLVGYLKRRLVADKRDGRDVEVRRDGRQRVDTLGCVDEVTIDPVARTLLIKGWALSAQHGPVERFRLSCGEREVSGFELTTGIASPDVLAALPHLDAARRSRFSILASLDEAAPRDADGAAIAVTPVVAGQEGAVMRAGGRVAPGQTERAKWFSDHYDMAARQVVDLFSSVGGSLRGRRVADIGSGDGIIDLGVVHAAAPELLVGFDIHPTRTDVLLDYARAHGVADELPTALEFRGCEPERLPTPDGSFDAVFSWSAFEHVHDPAPLLAEMRRILRGDGLLMIQLWPFFHSQHGSHLWQWFPDGFAQLLHSSEEIGSSVRAAPGSDPAEAERMLAEYGTLNRITLDELQRCLVVSGFAIVRAELLTEPFLVPRQIAHLPLSLLGISGVKLLAVPQPSAS